MICASRTQERSDAQRYAMNSTLEATPPCAYSLEEAKEWPCKGGDAPVQKCFWCDRYVHVPCSDAAKPRKATGDALACPWHRSNMVARPAPATPISVEPESKDKAAEVGFRPCSHKPCIAKKADNPPERRCQFVNGCSELVHIVCQPQPADKNSVGLTTPLCPAHLPVYPALCFALGPVSSLIIGRFFLAAAGRAWRLHRYASGACAREEGRGSVHRWTPFYT